ncbi:hypothetical protein [Sphingomonas sp. NIC1]|uniref:hypothetical protein n=1 Tax=Sphingomonas sp. NIC1 TaxID=1961362 RepID=UPI0007C0FAB1|nr:hypothetical protein [Sphingomonas sp. NIC1]ANC85461.1 hypothetical protein A7E77_00240 [Sphingomonas sp. NIC1]
MTGFVSAPAASQADIDAAIAAQQRTFSEYGGGFIDYTDNGYTQGLTTALAAGVPYQVDRDLTASAANTVSVGLLVPALGIGAVVAVPLAIYKVA